MNGLVTIFDKPEFDIIAGIGLMISLLIPVFKAFRNIKKANDSKNWDTTTGNLIESRVMTYKDEGQKMYKLVLRYSYTIRGNIYYGEGRYLDEEHGQSWMGELKKIADYYKRKKRLIVYYDYDKPKDSVLVKGNRPRYYLTMIALLAFFILGLIITISGILEYIRILD